AANAGVDVSARAPEDEGGTSTAGWVITSLGAAAVVGGAVMHGVTYSNRYVEGEVWTPDDENRYLTQRRVTYALYGVGAVGVGVGLFLLLRDGDERPARGASVDVSAGPGSASASMTWTF